MCTRYCPPGPKGVSSNGPGVGSPAVGETAGVAVLLWVDVAVEGGIVGVLVGGKLVEVKVDVDAACCDWGVEVGSGSKTANGVGVSPTSGLELDCLK